MERNKDPEREQYKAAITELIGGRVVAYYPMLARRIGGVKAAVMLSQLIYWSTMKEVRERPGNWIYKSVDEFEVETGLTKTEQQTARKVLTETGIIKVELRGVPRIWRYQINMDRIAEVLLGKPIDGQTHSMANPLNGKPIERLWHSMARPFNIDRQTDGTFTGKPTQLNKNLEITESQITTQITTTTMQPPELPSPELVVVVWDAALKRLSEMGIIAKQIPDYIALAQTSGWQEHQLIDLTRQLEHQYEKSRACRLLKSRICSDTPSIYGYTQSIPGDDNTEPDWYLPGRVLDNLERFGLSEDDLIEIDDISRAQGWGCDVSAWSDLLPRFESAAAFVERARNRPEEIGL